MNLRVFYLTRRGISDGYRLLVDKCGLDGMLIKRLLILSLLS